MSTNTCASAINYSINGHITASQYNATYLIDYNTECTILDTGEQFLLSNLPRPLDANK